jgi:hypothetical protein
MQTSDADQPSFFGGPTPAELAELIEHPDSQTAAHRWFKSTEGAGELLVAELAAAHANR